MKKLLYLLFIIFTLGACGSDNEKTDFYWKGESGSNKSIAGYWKKIKGNGNSRIRFSDDSKFFTYSYNKTNDYWKELISTTYQINNEQINIDDIISLYTFDEGKLVITNNEGVTVYQRNDSVFKSELLPHQNTIIGRATSISPIRIDYGKKGTDYIMGTHYVMFDNAPITMNPDYYARANYDEIYIEQENGKDYKAFVFIYRNFKEQIDENTTTYYPYKKEFIYDNISRPFKLQLQLDRSAVINDGILYDTPSFQWVKLNENQVKLIFSKCQTHTLIDYSITGQMILTFDYDVL